LSDLKAFRSNCHAAARNVGARLRTVQDRNEAVGYCNYAIAFFKFSDSAVAVLLNAVYPIIAFATWPTGHEVHFNYIDHPKLAEAFRELGDYVIAHGDEVNQPLLRNMCKELTPTERKSIAYFRSRRVGDVIFNQWD